MIPIPRTVIASFGLACVLAWSGLAHGQPTAAKQPDKRASAYYNFAMGHLYAELASTYGYRSDYVDKAIQHYRQALDADPGAGYVSEELTDLYMESGKLRDAVNEAEDMLKRDPGNIDARRMLGRIYSRLIGDRQQGRINDQMAGKAIEQYQKVVQQDPSDADSWLMLGRLYKASQDSVNSEKAYKKALELDPDNEFAISGLAQVYSDLGDSKQAVELWKKLADKDPRPQALSALARAYEDEGDYKSAAETLKRALDAAPKDPELKKNLAFDLLRADETDQALKVYNDLAQEDPQDPDLQLHLSEGYRQKRDFAKARAAGDRARELAPDSIEVKYNALKQFEAEGKTPEAIAQMKELIESTAKKSYSSGEQSSRAKLLQELGILYRMNDQFPEAIDTFRKAAALDPDSAPQSTAQIIDTYRAAKDFKKAELEADAALQKYPDNRTVKMVRAEVLADLGRTDEAAAATRQLLGGKDDRDTYMTLAQIYHQGKRFKDEAAALDSADKLSQNDDEKESVHFMRGAMFEGMKNLEAAEVEFRKVLDMNPESSSAMNYLGYMLADRNVRLTDAYTLIAKAVELEPNNGAYLDSLGWVDFRMGKLDEAEANLRRALQLSGTSSDPTVHDHLGDVLLQKGQVKDAIAQWELSLRESELGAKSEVDPAEVAKVQKKLESARVRLAKQTQHR